ncbi:MAG: phage virion morphogenesis protein [Zoogloeaceae bacterium]|jgi:phage virion morphogenesis protein|nr:phage virion morphogenesis protein [Zoogloeaceae bacterium]
MMTNSFSLAIDDKTVLGAFSRIAERFTPAGMRLTMEAIGEALAESTRRRFPAATGPDGYRWKPLATGAVLARYQRMMDEWSEERKYHRKDGSLNKRGLARGEQTQRASLRPLIDTGDLSRSIRYQVSDGGASVLIGTNREYAATHQFGATIRPKTKKALAVPIEDGSLRLVKKVTIPARPFLGMSADDKVTVLDILQRFLEEELPGR